MSVKTHYRTCNICEAVCGLIISHEDGEVLSIKPDPNDPLSEGFICPKAVALQDFRNDPDRITHPMRKTNGTYKEIGWDEAFEFAASRIRELQETHGRDSVGMYIGNPNAHKFGNMLNIPNLVKALGSNNRFSSSTADQIPHHLASQQMLGHPMLMPIPDIDRTEFMVIIGGNPLVSNGSIMTAPGFGRRMENIQARGGRIVVVDPRRTETALRADRHFFIQPETDAYLLLAMIHVVFANDMVKLRHLKNDVTGLNDLRHAVRPFTPELAEQKTKIPAADIRSLAIDFAKAESAVCYSRMGASTQSFGGLCLWATNVLNIITGNFDREGGAMFTTPAFDIVGMTSRKGRNTDRKRPVSRVSGHRQFMGEYPVSALAEEMETPGEGQIRGMITIAGNPVLTAPNGARIAKAMANLDFMMSIDIHLNNTTRNADLILPGTVALEESVYDTVFRSFAVRNTAGFARPLFEVPDGMLQEWEVIARLAAGLTGANSIGPSPEKVLSSVIASGPHPEITVDAMLEKGSSIDLGPLKPNLLERLETADGLLQLAPRIYLDDLERLRNFNAESDQSYPFAMIGRRQIRSHNSWTQNSKRLVKGKNRFLVEIHPEDATALGVKGGQRVDIRSRRGLIQMEADITENIAPGVVSIPQGWGQNDEHIGVATAVGTSSINDLTDDSRMDPLSGNAAFNGVPVQVEAVKPAAE